MSIASTSSIHGTPKREMRLMTTDSFHIELPSPSISPATMPETTQMAPSHLPVMFFNSSIPSINMLLPRETIKASTPQAMAAVLASASATRQAMFLKGTNTVQNQV